MKKDLIYTSVLILVLLGCQTSEADKRNEVLVLGMIHGSHRTQPEYSTEVLKEMIRKIDPDVILTEIPPDRFPIAVKEFQETDTIKEPRVIRFPEYVDVIFPLSKEMKFVMIPTAGWTKEMADARREKLREISQDSTRKEEWSEYQAANQLTDSLMKASGRRYDPYWIDTEEYDNIYEIRLETYNRLFNEELGAGGWDNINQSHYSYIANALDSLSNQGKRILITYGAGHKGWFLRALKKRDDIRLLTLKELVPRN
ncbi:MAG: hypothetical protein AAF391_12165 [Bacteroidota bacterium]